MKWRKSTEVPIWWGELVGVAKTLTTLDDMWICPLTPAYIMQLWGLSQADQSHSSSTFARQSHELVDQLENTGLIWGYQEVSIFLVWSQRPPSRVSAIWNCSFPELANFDGAIVTATLTTILARALVPYKDTRQYTPYFNYLPGVYTFRSHGSWIRLGWSRFDPLQNGITLAF